MVKNRGSRREPVCVPKLKPVKHLSDFRIKIDAWYKDESVTHTHASSDF